MPQYLLLALSIILAGCPSVYAQKLKPEELKEAWAALRKPMPDTARAKLYINLGESYSHNPFPELDSALYYIDLARTLSQASDFQWGQVYCDATDADIYREKGDHDKGLEMILRAKKRSEKYHLTELLIEAYLTMG